MNGTWDWPGSRWWRLDLHVHSPASYDFDPDQTDDVGWGRWITAARDADLDAVAITDHNSAKGIAELQAASAEMGDGPILFPGVELTATDGVHLVLLLDPTANRQDVEDLLSRAGIPPGERDKEAARAELSVEQVLERFAKTNVVIGAHVNRPKGILAEHDGEQRLAVLRNPGLAAVEVDPDTELDASWLDGSKPEVGRMISQVWNSDAHKRDQIGRRFTWVKMTRPNLEGLRLALLDGPSSLLPAKQDDSRDPNIQHGELMIESITVREARFMGRQEALTVKFNPWMNAIIGGRGTGKSTLVDLCRKTLRREAELDRSVRGEARGLRELFDRRMRTPPSRRKEGLLTKKTVVEVIYRKHAERFTLSWNLDGTAQPTSRLGPGGPTPESGGIPDRFPVRIYSQKQLFALAQDPNALLTIIDASPAVQAPAKLREIGALESKYLSLRAQARAAATRAEGLAAREADLADIRHKLDYLQEGGQAQQLSDYRRRQQQDDTWKAIVEAAVRDIAAIQTDVGELTVADLPGGPSDSPNDSSWVSLEGAHAALHAAVRGFQKTVQEEATKTARRIDEAVTTGEAKRWWQALQASEERFREASAALADQGIQDPAEYGDLLVDAARISREIQALQGEREQAAALDAKATATLALYRERCRELADERGALADEISNDLIRVTVRPFDDTQNLENNLTDILGTERFEADRKALAKRIRGDLETDGAWCWSNLDGLVADVRGLPQGTVGSWPAEDWRFDGTLRKVPPERIDRLALYAPGDTVDVRFRDRSGSWRPLAQGSPGQQTAALLAFVLGHGSEPIILDQPEDDLDTTLIYDLLVKQLKTTKHNRQVIVVTHNPNIVVHGDAEYVVSLDAGNGQSHVVCQGGLQEQKIRDEICRVMEGGRDAFERRYRRIMPPGGADQ